MGATQSSHTENLYKEYIKQQQAKINAQDEYIQKIMGNTTPQNILFKEEKPKLNPYQILGIENHNINERDLKKLWPDSLWNKRHLQLIFFGREHCPARNHEPGECVICSWAGLKKYFKNK